MYRMIAGITLALTLATSASGGEFSDASNRFRVTVPEGWTNEAPPDPMVALVVVSPRKAQTGGNCNVVVAPNPLKGQTQEEIDQQLSGVINAEFWKQSLAAVKAIKSSTIDDWGVREQRGRKVYYVKTTSEVAASTAFFVTQLMDLYPTPGQTFSVTCTARKESFEIEAKDFAALMTSFEPMPDMTVSAARTPRAPATLSAIAPQTTSTSAAAGVARALRH